MRKKPGPKPGSKKPSKQGLRGFVSRHKYAIASMAIVGAGAAGIVVVAKTLATGPAVAAGIAIGYVTVSAVGAVGALAMRDGQVQLKATLEKQVAHA